MGDNFFTLPDPGLFDGWATHFYKTTESPVIDEEEFTLRSMEIFDQEIIHSIFKSRLFYTFQPTDQTKQTEFLLHEFDVPGDPSQFVSFAKLLNISPTHISFIVNVAKFALLGLLRRTPIVDLPSLWRDVEDNASEISEDTPCPTPKKVVAPPPKSPPKVDQQNPKPDKGKASASNSNKDNPTHQSATGSNSATRDRPIVINNDDMIIDKDVEPTSVNKSSHDPPADDTDKKNKRSINRRRKRSTTRVITGYVPEHNKNVVDVLLYDIPASWDAEKILAELKVWGSPISISSKFHRKYQSVRTRIELSAKFLKMYQDGIWTVPLAHLPIRWYPASWSLKDRKHRESFQAVLQRLPDSTTEATLFANDTLCSFLTDNGVRAFKVVKDGLVRNLIVYLNSWADLKCLLSQTVTTDGDGDFKWKQHHTPPRQQKSNNPKRRPSEKIAGHTPSKKNPNRSKVPDSKNPKLPKTPDSRRRARPTPVVPAEPKPNVLSAKEKSSLLRMLTTLLQ